MGTHAVMVRTRTLSYAAKLVSRLPSAAALKVPAGEPLAAILLTALLRVPPSAIDTDGGPDLVFHVPAETDTAWLFGPTASRRLDVEVKSLPGSFRKFDADIDRALRHGADPTTVTHTAVVSSIEEILSGPGRAMINAAKAQLAKKSPASCSRNVFLIAHLLDYPYVEMVGPPLLAGHLNPLNDLADIDSVWLLMAPMSCAVWSRHHTRWTNVVLGAYKAGEEPNGDPDEDLGVLQQIEMEYLTLIGDPTGSPYTFGLTAGGDDEADDHVP